MKLVKYLKESLDLYLFNESSVSYIKKRVKLNEEPIIFLGIILIINFISHFFLKTKKFYFLNYLSLFNFIVGFIIGILLLLSFHKLVTFFDGKSSFENLLKIVISLQILPTFISLIFSLMLKFNFLMFLVIFILLFPLFIWFILVYIFTLSKLYSLPKLKIFLLICLWMFIVILLSVIISFMLLSSSFFYKSIFKF